MSLGRLFRRETTGITHFDLRLDRSCIFMPKDNNSEPNQKLTGALILCLSRDITVRSISVRLKGLTIAWDKEDPLFRSYHNRTTLNEAHPVQATTKSGAFNIPAGNHEFPFEIPIDQLIEETIMGVGHQYRSYEVQGEVERWLGKSRSVSRPVRFYAVPDLLVENIMDSLPLSVGRSWPEKVQYSVTIPSREIPFGSTFPVDFTFTPEDESLRLGSISIEILEKQTLRMIPTAADSFTYLISYSLSTRTYTIFKHVWDPRDDLDDIKLTSLGLDWQKTCLVNLPNQLNECTQDVDSGNFRVEHILHFTVDLINGDGHVSKIVGDVIFSVVMHPGIAGDEQNTVNSTSIHLDNYKPVPPKYGDHLEDQLFPLSTA